ncbi:hypothetical protein GCM10011506_01660 [Marivirga lumbricoides]|uniref:DNA mimic protein DMP19 C-terminal domain-containing protein n=1 Tax=Marivirga lumbricoides TaxID=1046115 RepID=A0ABQ1L933_9BACT|nr:hypothetical protein GCM10011506_01660 [Marivirga lumbricoides]
MDKDPYSGLSWMTEEMKNELMKRDKIVLEEDFQGLFMLKNNSDFSIALYEILVRRYERDPNSLNTVELDLFLCMHLENAGQADSILTFLQEWFPQYKERVIVSLMAIGAIKSSEIINQAVQLLPIDGSWFYDSSNEVSEEKMAKLDREFSNYPDGFMRELYRKYADKHKNGE